MNLSKITRIFLFTLLTALLTGVALADSSVSVSVLIRTTNRPSISDSAENVVEASRAILSTPPVNGPNEGRLQAFSSASARAGILSTNVQYFRTDGSSPVARGGDSIAIASFVDTITINPSDPSLIGLPIRLVFNLNLIGQNSILQPTGTSSIWEARANLGFRAGFSQTLLSNALVRTDSSGIPFSSSNKPSDGDKFATHTARAIYGEPLEISGTLSSDARIFRNNNNQIPLGFSSSDFLATITLADVLDGNTLEPISGEMFFALSGSGVDYFAIPEASGSLFIGAAVVLLIARRRI